MDEYGIFNDEGCIERSMWSRAEAEKIAYLNYATEDEVSVHKLCAVHEEQMAWCCEECEEEEEG